MTKLEQKLVELGYEYKPFMFDIDRTYIKFINRCKIVIDTRNGKVKGRYIQHTIFYQQDIDNLQQAFNEMQKDLEILKGIDKPIPKNDIGNDLWEKDAKHMKELGEWERNQWNH